MRDAATLVEVGLRDGIQPIGTLIDTRMKIDLLNDLYATGLRRIEVTSFVSPKAVPQLADAEEVLAAAHRLPDLDAQVLVPTVRQAERALKAGAKRLAFVLSVSEAHNQSNVHRAPAQSAEEYAEIVRLLPTDVKMRLNIATAFDCPYRGEIPPAETIAIAQRLAEVAPEAEIALCDTTGRVTPDRVTRLFAAVRARCPPTVRWAFHAHDTYGMGAANVWAAWQAGVEVFDASAGGLGGCPFAPGATGNVATEDVVWMFDHAQVSTGVDLPGLVAVAKRFGQLPGAQIGGRVRDAMTARQAAQRTQAA